MLIPFDMIAVMLYLGYYAETPVAAPPPLSRSILVILGCCAGVLAAAAVLDRAALAVLRRRKDLNRRRSVAWTCDLAVRFGLVAAYIFALEESALPWSAARAAGWATAGESFAVQMLGLAPYMLLFFAAWLPMYGLHRETSYGVWTRSSFIVHKARYNLFMLLAWIPFALLTDWLSEFMVLLPLLFLAAAWAFPYLLARAWGCRRLPDGEVRDMVHRLEKDAGARFSQIYVWEPGGGNTQNAAAVGIFRPFRYLFLTPALIKNMQGDELAAVVLHELGHVKKRHLLFYLFTSLAGINLAVLAGALLPLNASSERFIVTAVLVLGYFRLVFGWLSRNMERQADLFALEKSGSARGLANALEKLGLGAGNVRLASSWHHLGIAERVDYLRHAENNPEIPRRHNSGVAGIMVAGYMASVLVLGAITWVVWDDFNAGRRVGADIVREREHGDEAHWRRVMELMPDSPAVRLELAYRLAARPETQDEAAFLAREVYSRSDGETAAAAGKLLEDLTRDKQ